VGVCVSFLINKKNVKDNYHHTNHQIFTLYYFHWLRNMCGAKSYRNVWQIIEKGIIGTHTLLTNTNWQLNIYQIFRQELGVPSDVIFKISKGKMSEKALMASWMALMIQENYQCMKENDSGIELFCSCYWH